jgi:hypothetical protein
VKVQNPNRNHPVSNLGFCPDLKLFQISSFEFLLSYLGAFAPLREKFFSPNSDLSLAKALSRKVLNLRARKIYQLKLRTWRLCAFAGKHSSPDSDLSLAKALSFKSST